MYLLSAYDTGSICRSGIPQLHLGTVVAHTRAPYSLGDSVQRMGSSLYWTCGRFDMATSTGNLAPHSFDAHLLSHHCMGV